MTPSQFRNNVQCIFEYEVKVLNSMTGSTTYNVHIQHRTLNRCSAIYAINELLE